MRLGCVMPVVRCVLVVCLLLAGCGGGGGNDDTAAEPTTTAAVATASPSGTPSPTPAATASPFPEVLLAAGVAFHASGATALVLRNDGGGWQAVDLAGAPRRTWLNGVVFSEPEVAWAFGFFGDQETAVLLRSGDAGRTWADVTAALPGDTKGIFDLAWADASVGYLVSRGIVRSRFVFATTDGGRTWQRFDTFPFAALPGEYAIGTRGEAVELLLQDPSPGFVARVARVDLEGAPATVLDPPSNFHGRNSLATLGERAWIGVYPVSGIGTAHAVAIFTSAAPDAPWLPATVASPGLADVYAIDVRDAANAIAGGEGITPAATGLSPLILVLGADGAAWELASISGVSLDDVVVDVVRARGDEAWAIAGSTGANDSAFLRSDDGGRTWRHEPTPFESGVRLLDLARNSHRQ